MSADRYPILPPERTWPPAVDDIATRLVDALGGSADGDAALYLLMRCHGSARSAIGGVS